MHTIDEVKQELIEHLYSLDKTKMSVSELRTYADTVQVACNIAKSDKDDMFLEIFRDNQFWCSDSTGPPQQRRMADHGM